MSRSLMLAVASLMALALAACKSLPSIGGLDLNSMVDTAKEVKAATVTPGEDEERQMGHDVAATLLGASPLLANDEVQRYVNRVGLWVALQGSRPDLPWRFAVIDNPNVNAFATPGGYVFITRGLLERLRSEAELAGALGHEIAHVEKRHHLVALKKDARMRLLGRASSTAMSQTGTTTPDLERLNAVAGMAKGLYTRGLDKADEYEADRVGALLAARAGYDPYGLAQVLQTLDSVSPEASQFALLFKTHPKPADRLAQLDKALGARFEALGARPDVAPRFLAAVKPGL
jgi:beta-barrel assembly-enhancing protease